MQFITEKDCPDILLDSTGGASIAHGGWYKDNLFGKYRLDLNIGGGNKVYKKEGSNYYIYKLDSTWMVSY